jgi:outer membrane receptor protein involved in Fe transport
MKCLLILLLILTVVVSSWAQVTKVTLSGTVQDRHVGRKLPYVNVMLKTAEDSAFVSGTITNADGLFSIAGIAPGNYVVELSYLGYTRKRTPLLIGRLSEFLDLGIIEFEEATTILGEIVVEGTTDAVAETMEKKVFKIEDNIAQTGGSLLQVMQNLPGVTVSQEGTVRLRGSDRVTVLIDGKQTALTGFGNQTSLDNIPASAIDKIEVINNPSAKYEANGNAGIINIVYKKEVREGFNGKAGLSVGLGALWIKKENYPTIDPQYQNTPKINPSFSLNYRKKKTNIFIQADNLYTHTLNKNEFVDRLYDNGDTVRQQTRRNRNTNIITAKGGVDWFVNDHNTLTLSGLFSSEKIIDHGEEPFFNNDLSERQRLWRFLEDELKTTVTLSGSWQHKYMQPGRLLNIGYNYTFHREDEKYFFTNIMPTFTGEDSFKLISDEHVTDLTADYVHPLRHGRMEAGAKLRVREIPTDMRFFPGLNSPLDVSAGGYANYSEIIPVLYGNYVFESERFEAEAGLRMEYVDIYYKVDPNHNTYKSDGYAYTQPFPNLRLAYKIDPNNTLSLFYTRRVDRPNEVDIRIFPKYDDAEIIKVGNPGLRPQFTNSVEAGYKTSSENGYLYAALYHKQMQATISRVGSIQPGSMLIYNIFQNAGNSQTTGVEIIAARNLGSWATLNLNVNGYYNIIDAFSVVNQYPEENVFSAEEEEIYSGSIKLNGLFHFRGQTDIQLSTVYLAPDIIPQGKTYARFSIDIGAKKTIQNGNAEVFINASDVANTMRVKKQVTGDGFRYISNDFYETQVVRVGYTYKF